MGREDRAALLRCHVSMGLGLGFKVSAPPYTLAFLGTRAGKTEQRGSVALSCEYDELFSRV